MSRILIDNRYSLGDLLGIGGTAEVYLAHDEILDRDVALKVLRSQRADNEEFVKLFRREARSAAALNHPNVVPVYYWGRSQDGRYYMTMEYVSGGTLNDRVGPIHPSTVAGLGLQVADALRFAHEHGVIHRDVKPHNILLTEASEARVADFGIARAANATTTSQSSPFMGTAGYMSPEQAKGESVGPASDLYSLGVVLYEALTGELLGIGGTAEVYLAHDEILDRDVALKVLRSQHAENEEFVKLFRREARSAAALNHPNVVPVYYWGRSEDGRYYMTMEYVSGGTLKDRVGESLNPSTVIRLGLQVADALEFAHERGVVHRDVKPHNILLTEAGEARVADFGIARAANATTTSQLSPLMGTAGYLSPEQAKGESVGPASDLYSLGVVLYEALTGELPLNAEDPVALAMKHVNELPRSPREANPKVPNDLAALTLKLLAKRPEDRYPSAYALAQDLERVRHGLPPTIAPSEETTQSMSTPLLPGEEDQTRKIAVQLPVSGRPAWESEYGRRIHSRLFTILAALLLGLVLLGGLGWALSLYL